jgi:hypothetical protein
MIAEQQKRIKVLVVDDDESWGEGLNSQSKTLSNSELDVEFKNRYADGLRCIKEEHDIDVVVVDLFLDDRKVAFDFIIEAQRLGVVAPFVIISQASKQELLDSQDQDLLGQMIQSPAADFIEKNDVKPFVVFQNKIREALQNFRHQTEITISNIERRQREYLMEVFYIVSELRLLREIIGSYATKIKISAFNNLCSAIDERLDRIEHFTGSAYYELAPEPTSKTRALTDRSRSLVQAKRKVRELSVTDIVPFCPHRDRITKRLTKNYKRLRRKLKVRGDIHKICKSLHADLAAVANDSIIERVFFQIAGDKRSLPLSSGIRVIYELSVIYERIGKKYRIPALDAAAAIMLIDEGKMTEAAAYLKSARRRAAALGNDKFCATIDAIAPEEIENGRRNNG